MDEYNNMNPDPNGSPEPQQPDYASQYNQPQQPDYANQDNQQPQQPDYANQYNQQPQQPDYNAQYNQQPQQPDYNAQQYGQYNNYGQQPVQQYGAQPMNTYGATGDTYSGKVRAFSIVSLVCGICGLVFCWAPWVDFFFAIPAIIFGALAKKNYSGKNGMATVGLIFGIIGAALTTMFIIIYAATATRTYHYYY